MKKILITLALLTATLVSAKTLMTLKEFLKQEMQEDGKMYKLSKTIFKPSDDQKASIKDKTGTFKDAYSFYLGKKDDTLRKSCVINDKLGKEGVVQVGVCLDSNNKISNVEVLSSDEDRGKAVTERIFLDQFTNKNASDDFVVGKDIDGISGATISSKAVSAAVKEAGMTHLMNKGE